jgi:hypothetical protein
VTTRYQWKELSRYVQFTVGSMQLHCRLQGVLSANIAGYTCVEHAIGI